MKHFSLSILLIFYGLILALHTKAQLNVGIGTVSPFATAKLEVKDSNKGILLPRVNLKGSKDIVTVNPRTNSLLLYNIKDTLDVTEGYYYWLDTAWTRMLVDVDITTINSTDWHTKGNVIVGSTNFLGTTNAAPIPLRLNNIHAGFIGLNNTAIGYTSLPFSTTGTSNVAFGRKALQNCTTSGNNTAVGDEALSLYNDDGNGFNTAVGYTALKNTTSTPNNTGVGAATLITNTIGFDNTGIGFNADVVNNNQENSTAIGSGSRVSTSNTMTFGNASVEKWAFGRQTTPANQAIKVGTGVTNGNGAFLTDGGVWTNISDRTLKEDIQSVDGKILLQKIADLPIARWKYAGTNEYHIGPMSQDFYAAFQVGLDDKSISTIDPAGVALVAIQELKLQLQIQEVQNKALQSQVENLLLRLVKLEKL
ncbi:MAG: tail fiber domain-containing protein [Bacteroidota bacterium]